MKFTSTSRRPATATMSPAWITVSAMASMDLPFRRMLCTNTRWSGISASASCVVLPTTGPRSLTRNARNSNWCQAVPGPPASFLPPCYLLIPLACCLKVDAKERRTNQRQNNGGSDGSENVRDGVGHRHRISVFLASSGDRPRRLIASVARPIDAEIVCDPA